MGLLDYFSQFWLILFRVHSPLVCPLGCTMPGSITCVLQSTVVSFFFFFSGRVTFFYIFVSFGR